MKSPDITAGRRSRGFPDALTCCRRSRPTAKRRFPPVPCASATGHAPARPVRATPLRRRGRCRRVRRTATAPTARLFVGYVPAGRPFAGVRRGLTCSARRHCPPCRPTPRTGRVTTGRRATRLLPDAPVVPRRRRSVGFVRVRPRTADAPRYPPD